MGYYPQKLFFNPNIRNLFKPSTGKLKDDLERWGQMNDN